MGFLHFGQRQLFCESNHHLEDELELKDDSDFRDAAEFLPTAGVDFQAHPPSSWTLRMADMTNGSGVQSKNKEKLSNWRTTR